MPILQANKVVLSQRLQAIADLVNNGASVADIGCDHALLSIYLVNSGKAGRVLACDIKEGPLAAARKNVEKAGLDAKINLRLCDGLAGVAPYEVDTVIIAGMGGEVITEILAHAPWVQSPKVTLLLQPMSRPEVLRMYLYRTGFAILGEQVIIERGHMYTVMQVRFTGQTVAATPAMAHVGALQGNTQAERAYLQALRRRFLTAAEQLQNAAHTEDAAQFLHLAGEIEKFIG